MTRKELITSKTYWRDVVAIKFYNLRDTKNISKLSDEDKAKYIVDDWFMYDIKELSK